jgi:hypothetical protein
MRRHNMFDEVPPGWRFYSTGDYLSGEGVWVPVPVYWVLHTWRQVRIAYLRWSLRRTRQ